MHYYNQACVIKIRHLLLKIFCYYYFFKLSCNLILLTIGFQPLFFFIGNFFSMLFKLIAEKRISLNFHHTYILNSSFKDINLCNIADMYFR